MTAETTNDTLQVFQTRARQLMYEYEKVRNRCDELLQTLEQKDGEINALRSKIDTLEQSYRRLKTSKMIEINDDDVAKSKQRFDALVRQVDKCIALLNV